ncbi:hypothetical protein Aperf_G00000001100 [Anoplocephala perfoliata]
MKALGSMSIFSLFMLVASCPTHPSEHSSEVKRSKFAISSRYAENVLKYLLNSVISMVPLNFEFENREWSWSNSQVVTWLTSCQLCGNALSLHKCAVTGYNLLFTNSVDSINLGTINFDVQLKIAGNRIVYFKNMLWYNATAVVTRSTQRIDKPKLFKALTNSLRKTVESAMFIIP